jgi:hypothetical protein
MWVQLGGSLVAILALAGIAWALRLGGGTIGGETEAVAAADEVLSGFEGDRATVASDGRSALVLGRDGSLAVLKMHGARPAARRLQPPFAAETTGEGLRIATGDPRFGAVTVRGVDSIPSPR